MRITLAATLAASLFTMLLRERARRTRRALAMVEHDFKSDGALPLPPANPNDVGLLADRLEHITRWSDGWIAAGKVPGMITCIARKGKLVYMHASGHADIETKQPFRTNTVVRAYSMTKVVTSVVVMILYERGYFQLDEPISHHLPSFANPRVLLEDGTIVEADREITVRDLLTHTAGLGYGDGEGDIDELYTGARVGWNTPPSMSLSEFVDRLGRLPLGSHPGDRWRYSYASDVSTTPTSVFLRWDAGAAASPYRTDTHRRMGCVSLFPFGGHHCLPRVQQVLGRLIEVLVGLPLDEVYEREVFKPLGMVDSCFQLRDDEMAARFAQVGDCQHTISKSSRKRIELDIHLYTNLIILNPTHPSAAPARVNPNVKGALCA